ncbi:hypothetical protein SAMN05443575_3021 [Jatrophihabitans endophyticus]|uniref:DoxX-like family protein n=1 Tax=Jatrophihabitans endophyticus TaxID=1206085 RepID=A0A1M5PA53_9ACTN|nr:hypothetical protein [Jatrophihabitans endophyticus]SHG98632.1 hypothetical protein SAMN05443575_3021 [Jatrophihabitans endophyticus]
MALFSAGKVGLLLAATGVAHFVVPERFAELTKQAFPEDTDQWVQRNGAAETAIGLALMARPLRKGGKLALVGYLGWLGYNAANVAQSG